jgi:hypothetical protein
MYTWVRGAAPLKDGDEQVVSLAEHSPALMDAQDELIIRGGMCSRIFVR